MVTTDQVITGKFVVLNDHAKARAFEGIVPIWNNPEGINTIENVAWMSMTDVALILGQERYYALVIVRGRIGFMDVVFLKDL